MRIGILGSGNVGGTLGTRWAAAGHTVAFASRQPEGEAMQALVAAAGPNARATTAADAVASSAIVLLATPWPATKGAVDGLDWTGKVLIDATNPLLPGLAGLEYANVTSGAEQLAAWAPGATLVKAFNTVGYNVMANPEFGGQTATLFYCGDDAAAKATVKELGAAIGFSPEDAGPLRQARLLEPFALLWISLAMAQGYGRNIGFSLLRR
jgi:predicted dinucleotide-binding enzyme